MVGAVDTSHLPHPVAEAFEATNNGDLERFTAAFATDGVVDDSGREFQGRRDIAGWSLAESIGVKQTFRVAGTHESHDKVVVTAEVGGGGYIGRATFTFTLSTGGDTIQRMTISG